MPLQCTKIQFLYIKTFDVGGKKVGYLAYSSFDLDSAEKLVDICCQFKQEGISELILDLRYNGGGYVFTENVLAFYACNRKMW